MDLEALPPEDPTPATPGMAGGEQPMAPRPSWEPAPWQPASADAPASDPAWGQPAADPIDAGSSAVATRLGFSRSTKIVSGALALAVVAGGAWAAGTALHSSGPTVRFQPAAASTAATTGGTGTTPGASHGPGHRGGFGRGGGGTVASVDQAGSSFTVTVPDRPAPPTTPGAAPVTPAAPTTKSLTIKVTATTTYTTTKQGTLGDVATGMRVFAVGTANTDGSLAATHLQLVQAGIGPNPPAAPATAPTPPSGAAPTAPADRPAIAVGTVTTVTKDVPAAGDITIVVSTPRGNRTVTATSTTTVTVTTKGTFADVAKGELVLARGARATDGTITATDVQIVASGIKGGRGGFGFGPGFGGRGPGFGPGGAGPRFGGGMGGHWGEGGTPGAGQSSTSGAAPSPI